VQLIKLAQAEVGRGSIAVRAPRLALEGAELAAAQAVIRASVASRLALDSANGKHAAAVG
jgi:1-pyrroline-4-hydroxy-2-carboxylate deaminase